MNHNIQFLPTEIQASIAELRALGTPDSAIDLLVIRILKASEAKVTSLQMDLERIETSFEHRYGLLEGKLIADNQTRTGDIYQMVSDVRNAQLAAHPQISEALTGVKAIQKTNEDMEIWVGRLEAAFVAGRDYAAGERGRLEARIDSIDERLVAVEARIDHDADPE